MNCYAWFSNDVDRHYDRNDDDDDDDDDGDDDDDDDDDDDISIDCLSPSGFWGPISALGLYMARWRCKQTKLYMQVHFTFKQINSKLFIYTS